MMTLQSIIGELIVCIVWHSFNYEEKNLSGHLWYVFRKSVSHFNRVLDQQKIYLSQF